jgi:ComF family protein
MKITTLFPSDTIFPLLKRLLAPQQCGLCDRLLREESYLCGACDEGLTLLPPSRCEICSLPFEGSFETEHRCGDCLAGAPNFAKASCTFRFEGGVVKLLHRLKFGGQWEALDALVPRALPGFREILAAFQPEWLVPVPLPWWRRLRRGFNQSMAIAMRLRSAANSKIPCFHGLRRRASQPQALRGREERGSALRGAFRVTRPESLRGRRLLVVDDVLTTGATAESLSKTLLQAGAQMVQVFTLARTQRRSSA